MSTPIYSAHRQMLKNGKAIVGIRIRYDAGDRGPDGADESRIEWGFLVGMKTSDSRDAMSQLRAFCARINRDLRHTENAAKKGPKP